MDSTNKGFCSVAGTSLYYEVTGAGTPIVFLHGNPCDLTVWDFQAEFFARDYQVIRYDLRGFGRSEPGTEPYTHADDLTALLDCLKLRQVYLVGWSMGGGAVINFTLTHPDRVKGLIVVDSSLGGFPYSEEFKSSYGVFSGSAARELGLDAAKEKLLAHALFEPLSHHPEGFSKVAGSVKNYSGWHWLNKDPGKPFNPPAMQRLNEIKIPTLVLVGDQDLSDFQQIAKTLGQHITSSQTVVIKDSGHAPFLEQIETFNHLVSDFIRITESKR